MAAYARSRGGKPELTGSIEVEGLQRVLDVLRSLGRGLEATAADDAVTNVLLDEARRRAPMRTGRLRGSGRVDHGTVVFGSASVPYAPPIHWGWPQRNIVGQPFLQDAMNDPTTQAQVLATWEREAQNLINKEST